MRTTEHIKRWIHILKQIKNSLENYERNDIRSHFELDKKRANKLHMITHVEHRTLDT